MLSLAHTFPSRLLTFRLADVLDPLYFLGEFWALPVGVPVAEAGDLFLARFFREELLFLKPFGAVFRKTVAIQIETLPEEVSGLLRVLQLQPDLRQNADQELVHVVVDADRCLYVLAVVVRRH